MPRQHARSAQLTPCAVCCTGVVVSLPNGLEGLLHVSQISQLYVRSVEEIFEAGEAVCCVVIDIRQTDGSIRLSTKMLEQKPGDMVRDKAEVFARAARTLAGEADEGTGGAVDAAAGEAA